MMKSQRRPRLGETLRLGQIEFVGPAEGHRAETAASGADLAQDHEGCRSDIPTFPDVGAPCLFADRVKIESLDELTDL